MSIPILFIMSAAGSEVTASATAPCFDPSELDSGVVVELACVDTGAEYPWEDEPGDRYAEIPLEWSPAALPVAPHLRDASPEKDPPPHAARCDTASRFLASHHP